LRLEWRCAPASALIGIAQKGRGMKLDVVVASEHMSEKNKWTCSVEYTNFSYSPRKNYRLQNCKANLFFQILSALAQTYFLV
ncbi:MAG: hypothetical protein ORN29_05915, partial [Rhodoferax sp.]|nr:hypothetical protein [Rhodoferax sp.]